MQILGGGAVAILLVIVSCGVSFFLGGRLRRLKFEVRGLKEIEKHLVRQIQQREEIERKYDRLRRSLGGSSM